VKHLIRNRSLNTALILLLLAVLSIAAYAQTYAPVYQFKAGLDGNFPSQGLIVDLKRGVLYGTTSSDGAFLSGTVFKLGKSGEAVLYSFTGENGDGQFPEGGGSLYEDANGNLYGTAFGGIYGGPCGTDGCGVVFEVDQTGHEKVLYQFTGGDDGTYPNGGLVGDENGNLYGTTQEGGKFGSGTVFEVTPSGTETVLHSFNYQNYSDGSGPATGLIRDASGNLFGTTGSGGISLGGTVFKIDTSYNETILYYFGSSSQDGLFPASRLAFDTQGNLIGMTISGGANGYGTVFRLTLSGQETVLYNFGPSPDANRPYLTDPLIDPSGNIYAATNYGGADNWGAVFKLDTSNHETVLHSFDGPHGKLPYGGLARDPSGNIYGTASQGGAYGGGLVYRVTP